MNENETKETGFFEKVLISAFLAGIVYLPFGAMGFTWGIFFALWILISVGFIAYK